MIAIDQAVDHWQCLAEKAALLGDVVILNSQQDGVEQISNYLQERRAQGADPITNFSLISHGRSGGIQLGKTWLNLNTIDAYSQTLAGWQESFSSGADLLLWGCDVADGLTGQALVNKLGLAMGTDVAASSNRTTNQWMGGDVTLEYSYGAIDNNAQNPIGLLLSSNLHEALAVSAKIVNGDLCIDSTAPGDVLAEIASDGTTYTVSGTGLAATQFLITDVTGLIKVGDPVGIENTFRVMSDAALANPLLVTSSVETTELFSDILTTVPGDVFIGSASVKIGSVSSVLISTSATNGRVDIPGTVTLNHDTTIRSGSGSISFGGVASSQAVALTLGDANQTGPVNITGNVNLPFGYVITKSGAFDVSLEGATNSIRALDEVLNRGALRIGQAGGTSRISDGLVATAPPEVSLAGVIETVNNTLRLGNVKLRADTTLRSGTGEIQTGTVTDDAEAFTLSLGSVDQIGGITLGGSVTVDDLVTAAGTFSVSLLGDQNDIAQQVTFANTF